MLNYGLLDEDLRGSFQRYIEHRIQPGGFLTAVLANDLMRACACADVQNRGRLFAIAQWVFNEAPSACHGSPERVEAWLLLAENERLRADERILEKSNEAKLAMLREQEAEIVSLKAELEAAKAGREEALIEYAALQRMAMANAARLRTLEAERENVRLDGAAMALEELAAVTPPGELRTGFEKAARGIRSRSTPAAAKGGKDG